MIKLIMKFQKIEFQFFKKIEIFLIYLQLKNCLFYLI